MKPILALLIVFAGIACAEDCKNLVYDCGLPYFQKGSGYDSEGQIECYDSVIEQYGSCPEAWYAKAVSLQRIGKWESALSSINKSIESNSGNFDYWLKKGEILSQLNRFKEAVGAFDAAIKIDSNSAYSFHQKGLALYKIGKYSDSIASYDKALGILDINESNNLQSAIELWGDKGRACSAQGNEVSANEAYAKVKELEERMRKENRFIDIPTEANETLNLPSHPRGEGVEQF
jgi:tetratricopeptide (TPR) repeat protein